MTRTAYTINYSDHEDGSGHGGSMLREGLERAQWSANLMRECGYKTVTVTPTA